MRVDLLIEIYFNGTESELFKQLRVVVLSKRHEMGQANAVPPPIWPKSQSN